MIENEKQYEVSKKTLGEVVEKINQMKSNPEDSLKQKLVLMSIEQFRDQIEEEIKEYEAKNSKAKQQASES